MKSIKSNQIQTLHIETEIESSKNHTKIDVQNQNPIQKVEKYKNNKENIELCVSIMNYFAFIFLFLLILVCNSTIWIKMS